MPPQAPVSIDQRPLPRVWRRAAALGGVWAAVEIVVGSFLHNVRFPLTGTLLACLGICLLVAGCRVWPDRGLAWRAGLVCALMKSVSPSAVVLGPMIGIVVEALLLEAGVRLFGRNAAGLAVGGALAALEPLGHKAASLVLTFGADAARLYAALCELAAGALRTPALGPGAVLLAFTGLSLVSGLAAVALGMAVGRQARSAAAVSPAVEPGGIAYGEPVADPWAAPDGQRFAPILLAAHLAALAAGLALLGRLPWPVSLGAVLAYGAATFARYERVRRRLARPRLWIELAIVSLLAGLLLGGLTADAGVGRSAGLATGGRMALRAVLVITAFAAIGVELRNPVLMGWLLRRGLGGLSAAVGIAFAALPHVASRLGDQRRLWRAPVRALGELLADAVRWLDERETGAPRAGAIWVLTGGPGDGKTALALQLASRLRQAGAGVAGIVAPASVSTRRAVPADAYDILDLDSGRRAPLCRLGGGSGRERTGRFTFTAEGLALGRAALARAAARRCEVVVVDELGPLELRGGGLAPAFTALLDDPPAALLLVVRRTLVDAVVARWNLRVVSIWDAGATDAGQAAADVLAALGKRP